MPARPRRALVAVLVVALALTLPGAAVGQPEVELEAARERAADLDTELERAEQRLAEAAARVGELEEQLRAAGDDLERAENERTEAEASAELARGRAERATQQLEAVEGELDHNQDALAAFARETYKQGAVSSSPTAMTLRSLTGGGADELADSLQGMRLGLRSQQRVVEEAQVLRTQAEVLVEAMREEERIEQGFLDEAVAASDRAAEAHARSQQLVADASTAEAEREARLEELAEARSAVDGEITELEAEVERERAEREARERAERERAEREAAEQAAAERRAEERRAEERRAEERRAEQRAAEQRSASRSSGSSGGSSSGNSSSGGSSSGGSSSGGSSSGGSTSVRSGPAPGLVTVGGITVASSLGPNLQALLDAARADGIVLGGSGYRSPDAQAALRRANGCPDVWTSPASSCRVPTAIPGSSEHEKGLAVDFTYQGRTICFPRPSSSCQGNRAFDWLRANAGRFGLRNLPSEAWHWSTTGR
jgi:zinc D-Ala-D-Ala carboxypeptidase